MSGPQPVRVVKVGGSLLRHQPEAQVKENAEPGRRDDKLFGWPDFPAALRSC